MKINKTKFESFFYISILLLFSGNPVFSISTQFGIIAFCFMTITISAINFRFFVNHDSRSLYLYMVFFCAIFFLQRLFLGFLSYPGVVAFFLKIILGFVVICVLRERFRKAYFDAIYAVSLISLVGYIFNLLGLEIPEIFSVSEKYRSVIIYAQHDDGSRNTGMFWEPGAFACYINLAFLLYLGHMKQLLKSDKRKVFINVLALLTTFSTTGYFVLLIIISATIIFEYFKALYAMIIPILFSLFVGSWFLYEMAPFLQEKVEWQLAEAQNLSGEFSNTRFGALAFDTHYIKKSPWVGNGLHQKTRYADHPWLHDQALGHGNGFSNFLASMGILSFVFYSLLILRNNRNLPWIFLGGVIALLQGEQLMNFPLFLVLPLVFINGKESRRITDVP